MDPPVVTGSVSTLHAYLFILLTLTSTVVYAQSFYEDDTLIPKNHLNGIRPLSSIRPIAKPLEQVTVDDSLFPQRSNVRRHRVKTVNTVATGSFKNRLLSAVKEALSDYDGSSHERTKYSDSSGVQRSSHPLPEIVTPALPSPTDNTTPRRPIPVTPSKNQTNNVGIADVPTGVTSDQDETSQMNNREEAKRRARTQARWLKLGPLVRTLNFPYTRRNPSDVVRLDAQTNTVRKIVRQRLRQLSSKSHLSNRPRINGPILTTIDAADDDDDDAASTLVNLIPSERTREFVRNQWYSDSSPQPQRSFPLSTTTTTTTSTTRIPITEPPSGFDPSDYHFRTVAPIKKYKFTQKLRQRPRLRIRRPGETPQISGNRTAASVRPLALPMLTPFRSTGDHQSMPRSRFDGHSRESSELSSRHYETPEKSKHFDEEHSTFGGGSDAIAEGGHKISDGRRENSNGRQTGSGQESVRESYERSRIDERNGGSEQRSGTFSAASNTEFGIVSGGFGGGNARFGTGSERKSKWDNQDNHESAKGREVDERNGKFGGELNIFGGGNRAEFSNSGRGFEGGSGKYGEGSKGLGGGGEPTWSGQESAHGSKLDGTDKGFSEGRPTWDSHESIQEAQEGSRIEGSNSKIGRESKEFGGGSGAEVEAGFGALGGEKFEGDNKGFNGGRGKPIEEGDEFNGFSEESTEGSGRFDGGNGGFDGNGGFSGGSGAFGRGGGNFGRPTGGPPIDFGSSSISLSGTGAEASTEISPESSWKTSSPSKSMKEETLPSTNTESAIKPPSEEFVIPQNSGLRSVAPPPEFQGEFGSSRGGSPFGTSHTFAGSTLFGGGTAGGGFGLPSIKGAPESLGPGEPEISGPRRPKVTTVEESIFTGETAFTPNRNGPTGDGFGPPLFPGAAVPPPVPAIGLGGDAAGLPPYHISDQVRNPPTTMKPSALLSVLNKADLGFNQAINHFEQGTPLESAAIDILEVALGSQKLDSQAKLLGHVDRTIGIDNLQRLQRWANTGGALDALKEQFVKIAKNYSPPDNLLPTIPPQLSYLFTPTGKR